MTKPGTIREELEMLAKQPRQQYFINLFVRAHEKDLEFIEPATLRTLFLENNEENNKCYEYITDLIRRSENNNPDIIKDGKISILMLRKLVEPR
jgi:hypothetical protein